MVPWRTLNGRHSATAQCARGAEQKRRRLAEEELRESTERSIEAYDAPLEHVTAFKYLKRVMTVVDNDWPAGVGNLQRVSKSWGYFLRILILEGADLKLLVHFYKSVSQAVLLI